MARSGPAQPASPPEKQLCSRRPALWPARVRTFFEPVADFLAPRQCLLCQLPTDRYQAKPAPVVKLSLCQTCIESMPGRHHRRCPVCAIAGPHGEQQCAGCQHNPPPFQATLAVADYAAPVSDLIRRLKYRGQLPIGAALGIMLSQLAMNRPLPERPDLVVPVPLSKVRLRERGFNQSILLARPLASALGAVFNRSLLTRTVSADPQAGKSRNQRLRSHNPSDFDVAASINGANVALVDDVMTSGATLSACANTLLTHGAASVSCFVVARTATADSPPDGSGVSK